jgi:hypothetical protein
VLGLEVTEAVASLFAQVVAETEKASPCAKTDSLLQQQINNNKATGKFIFIG